MRSNKNSPFGPDRPNRPQGKNTLRIIGGKWRGRKLSFPAEPQLRPTGDRIRETLFNWLSPSLPGAHCLDLFAGSGALALEAVSRGAGSSTLIDSSTTVCKALDSHRRALAAENELHIVNGDALDWLQRQARLNFDIIFLDPPFDSPLLAGALNLLETQGRVASGVLLYVESASDLAPSTGGLWRILRSKQAGKVKYQLLEKIDGIG